jgi:phosphoribosyl-ATP pyrophosphohydrolase/phosphoribosyl-AMP cyclohydrolase
LKKAGLPRIAQKVGEEAVETVIAALTEENSSSLLEESADLLFHLLVLLREKNTSLGTVAEILKQRNLLKRVKGKNVAIASR